MPEELEQGWGHTAQNDTGEPRGTTIRPLLESSPGIDLGELPNLSEGAPRPAAQPPATVFSCIF